MIVDGKAIARQILMEVTEEVKVLGRAPQLRVFTCAPNFETQKFLRLKQRRAAEVGVRVEVVVLEGTCSTESVVAAIGAAVAHTDGIIVQLPFPSQIDMATVLEAVPATHDVDALRYRGEMTDILPPVVGAIDAIARHHGVTFLDARVVVVGQGRLVGLPAAAYARAHGALVDVVVKDTPVSESTVVVAAADILILGAGVPGLVTASHIKPGVTIFDAGTSEEDGVLVGDADPRVSVVAGLITPVPGGIGPITIAILLQNLVRLTRGS